MKPLPPDPAPLFEAEPFQWLADVAVPGGLGLAALLATIVSLVIASSAKNLSEAALALETRSNERAEGVARREEKLRLLQAILSWGEAEYGPDGRQSSIESWASLEALLRTSPAEGAHTALEILSKIKRAPFGQLTDFTWSVIRPQCRGQVTAVAEALANDPAALAEILASMPAWVGVWANWAENAVDGVGGHGYWEPDPEEEDEIRSEGDIGPARERRSWLEAIMQRLRRPRRPSRRGRARRAA
ncbi:hypothetical protein OVA14_07105 [Agrococcus sp. SL85]|uniref:hypothetical protein n=1 Tax=Agrococcus sp. SL85 TaxID=2995141 RepID=UPI00226CFF10|nr:hypothetical protein [Agrococcus sp. SL85]WAC65161.1 hypothetical protein OVA14_07105 [Agrococcus sp. SL85]